MATTFVEPALLLQRRFASEFPGTGGADEGAKEEEEEELGHLQHSRRGIGSDAEPAARAGFK